MRTLHEAMRPRERNQIHGQNLTDRGIECTSHPAHQSGYKMDEVSESGGVFQVSGDTQGQSERKFSRAGRYAELLCQSRQSTNGVLSRTRVMYARKSDLFMSSQALQATPQLVGQSNPGHYNEHNICLLCGLRERFQQLHSGKRHAAPVIEHRKFQHHLTARVTPTAQAGRKSWYV